MLIEVRVVHQNEVEYADGAVVNFRVEVWKETDPAGSLNGSMVLVTTGEKFSGRNRARIFADGLLTGLRCAGIPIDETTIVEHDER